MRTIDFESLLHLLINLGFTYRIKGSHHIFTKTEIDEIINIQPKDGKAKPYQVKQIRNILTENKLISDES
jgi:predicted RNA binding protein YcfA (HicA-like mRNA interferase family)